MSTEDKIEILKDCLRPYIRKLLDFTGFETVSDLKQAALEIDELDAEKVYEEKSFKITETKMRSDKSTKKEEIDFTVAAIVSEGSHL